MAAEERGRCPTCHATYATGERFCPRDGGAIVHGDEDRDDPLIGATIDERYFIRRLLGRGGMGAVYEADHVGLDRRVAIKFITGANVDRDARARFRNEARAASRIVHGHVVQIFDVGTDDADRDFIVMEYVAGKDLRAVLTQGPLDPARAVAIARQVLSGLHAIHEVGIVHRDIKPANILLADGDGDVVKIMDFGISKVLDTQAVAVTRSGQVIGTPEYMAPELLAGGAVDRRADLYSVGLTLYAMITGELPFVGTSFTELAAKHLRDAPPALDVVRPGTPAALVAAVARALAKAPADRFATALAFADALGEVTSPTGLVAPAVTAQTAVERPVRKGAVEVTVRERPLPQGASPSRGVRWGWLVAGVAVVGGIGLAVALWPRAHEASPPPPPPVPTAAADPLAPARAAESAGNLELAIARYLEAYDASKDPELMFRIGELYERLDRTADATLYFGRYLERAPTARDRAAVAARIARLQAPIPSDAGGAIATAVDASGPALHRRPPLTPATTTTAATTATTAAAQVAVDPNCQCVVDVHEAPGERGMWLCDRKQAPLCACVDDSRREMCPQPFEHCVAPGCVAIYTTNDVGYSCVDPRFREAHLRAIPGVPCEGYSTGDIDMDPAKTAAAPKVHGVYACTFCKTSATETAAQHDQRWARAGHTGDRCEGVLGPTGQWFHGRIDCTPK